MSLVAHIFLLLAFLGCGQKQNMSSPNIASGSIVGGFVDEENQFAFVGQLIPIRGGQENNLCSGTLIEAQWVLTAAHCLDNFWSARSASLNLIEGQDDVSVKASMSVVFAIENRHGELLRSRIDKIYMHGQYSRENLGHDLALVKLKEPLSELPVAKLSFEQNFTQTISDIDFVAVGYGLDSTGEDGRSGVKKYTSINIDRAYNLFLSAPQGQSHPYRGDSGGPLLIEGQDGSFVAGVISHGLRFSRQSDRRMYFARLSSQKNWYQGIRAFDLMRVDQDFSDLITWRDEDIRSLPSYAHYFVAQQFYEKSEFSRAINHLDTLHERDQREYLESLQLLYYCHTELGNQKKAQELWDKLFKFRNFFEDDSFFDLAI